MTTKQEARKAVARRFGSKQDVLNSWPAYLGNEDGTVRGSRANYVYVRYPSVDSAAVEIYNGGVPEVAGLRVMIGYRSERPDLLQALGVSDVRAEIDGTIIYGVVKTHARQHAWTGSDPVYVAWRQITDLGVYVSSGLIVAVQPGVLQRDAAIVSVAAQTLDLTSHQPDTSTQGRFALITLDADGVLSVTDGDIVADSTDLDIEVDIPATPAGHFRLAAIRLYNGQTAIVDRASDTDIVDLRWPQERTAGGVAPPAILLTDGYIFVGDATDHAAEVLISGDATIANTGALTLATVNADVGTYGDALNVAQITVNAKGLVTAMTEILIDHAEVLMADGVTPPDPLTLEDQTDWLYEG
jgi:hypothetical protein